MEARINAIGAFDVRIVGLSMEDALKALDEAKTPKVVAALQAAINSARARASGDFSIIDVSPDCAELFASGEKVATIHHYTRGDRTFWQGYVKKNGKNVRRASKEELADAIATMFHEVNVDDLL